MFPSVVVCVSNYRIICKIGSKLLLTTKKEYVYALSTGTKIADLE